MPETLISDLLSRLPLVLIVLGALTIVSEASIPGGPFFVTGFSLLVSGIIGFILEIHEPWLLGLFAMLAGIVGLLLYRHLIGLYGETEQSTDANALMGEVGTATQTISQRESGEIYLPNSDRSGHYQAKTKSGTITEGETIRVTDPRGGSLLLVERIEDSQDQS